MSFCLNLVLRNYQRLKRVDLRLLRRIAKALLVELLAMQDFDLGIYIVDTAEITRLNETFLNHAGSTDVITFNYLPTVRTDRLHGEIFICLEEGIAQAHSFRTTWAAEVVRYLVHGVLHLRGRDDLTSAARRRMKREEDSLVRELARRFAFTKLGLPRASR